MNSLAWVRSTWFVPVLTLVALVLAAVGYFPALAVIGDLEGRLMSSKETLVHLSRIIEVGQAAASASSQSVSPFGADFLSGANESLVVARLQSRLRELAIQNNVELNRSNNLPARTEGGVSYPGLRIVLRGEIKDIQRVLHIIETGKPLLFVSRATMRMDSWPTVSRPGSRMDSWSITPNEPERNGPPALIAELDVFGAMMPTGNVEAELGVRTDNINGNLATGTESILPSESR